VNSIAGGPKIMVSQRAWASWRGPVARAGGLLLAETARVTDLGRALSRVLVPSRLPLAVYDPGRSCPTQKARSPAPVSNDGPHLTVGLGVIPDGAGSSCIRRSIAFRTAGQSSVTQATCSFFSYRTRESPVSLVRGGLLPRSSHCRIVNLVPPGCPAVAGPVCSTADFPPLSGRVAGSPHHRPGQPVYMAIIWTHGHISAGDGVRSPDVVLLSEPGMRSNRHLARGVDRRSGARPTAASRGSAGAK
jgi:hypothetical protein